MWSSLTQLNSDSTSRLAIKRELSYFVISLAKLKESLTVNSLWVKVSKVGIKNFARSYPGVLIAERIGLDLGVLSTTGLWTFGLPYRIAGLEPTGQILRNSSYLILLLSYKLLKKFITFFSTLTI